MPYSNLPDNPELVAKMDSCVRQVMAQGHSKPSAIAICYSSLVGKKVLLTNYPVADRPVGDLIPAQGEKRALSWSEVEQQPPAWAAPLLSLREQAWQCPCAVQDCGQAATRLLTVGGEQLAYCDEHVSGAKELLAKHRLAVSADEPVVCELIEVRAEGQSITKDDRFISSPDSGARETSGEAVNATADTTPESEMLEPDMLESAKNILANASPGGRTELPNATTTKVPADLLASVRFYHTLDSGQQATVMTLSLYTTGATALEGDTDYWRLLAPPTAASPAQPLTPAEAAALLETMRSAPERFDGSYLRAEFEDYGIEASTLHGLPQAVAPLTDSGVPGAVALAEKAAAEPVSAAAPVRVPTLDELAQAIAAEAKNKKVDAALVRTALLEPWLQSVFGTPASNRLQKVAARTFGFPDPPGTAELDINWSLLYPMGALYNLTQRYLKARGFSDWQTVPVYRPYIPSEARPKQWQEGDKVRIKLLPLTSWSLAMADAAKVAQRLGTPRSPALVLKTFIPISSVVSTPLTGIGIPGTSEVVLAGGEYEALVEKRYG